ncbi:hypothetical protein KVR01_001913 [Diaporthe batatas]|uniref:uncharacterized protein n=1 Tax=Diaporthe batatas TaxID=748121 RepID=UPI001D05B458|nr:uncharacterized protein KVR01_001913 [Diaporthe batatas]KAG8169164.1 hypothetical protein KVR01_001913 [Diaporthe batatas]
MDQPGEQQALLPRQGELDQQDSSGEVSAYARRRERCQALLQSKQKHYLILALVALDVSCLLADIFITLIDCDSRIKNDAWVPPVHKALEDAGLVFSCLFLAELIASLWAFGFEFFHSWFHVFDAAVIIASFLVDVLTRGVVEEVASLIIILRLWRFVKIIEELSVASSERMEDLETRIERLEEENSSLRDKLRKFAPSSEGEP